MTKPVARIYNGFIEKFGIPRQSGLLPDMLSEIIPEKEFASADAFRGIEEFSHLWLLWEFSENPVNSSLTVRPPRLGGNTRVGVFATRSPFRPNGIGLSSVKLEKVITQDNKCTLIVSGADLLSGTPILDIKPYISYTDSHPDACCGFADEKLPYRLNVVIPEDFKKIIKPQELSTVYEILAQDPRPSYQNDKNRIYKMSFSSYEISFSVDGDTLTVKNIKIK